MGEGRVEDEQMENDARSLHFCCCVLVVVENSDDQRFGGDVEEKMRRWDGKNDPAVNCMAKFSYLAVSELKRFCV